MSLTNSRTVRMYSRASRRAANISSSTSRHILRSGACGQPRVGVVYLSFGEEYKALTTLSVSFLRGFGYAGPIRIVTDSKDWTVDQFDCDLALVPSRGLGFATRYYKTQINQYAFDTTLFLDADTLPIASIRPIWHELRFAEICLPLDFHTDSQGSLSYVVVGCESNPREYSHMAKLGLLEHEFYNSNVILFRRSRATDRIFTRWHEEWKRFALRDQLALVRAVARSKANVHILPSRWNGRLTSFGSIRKAIDIGVRLVHLRPGISSGPTSSSEIFLKHALRDGYERVGLLQREPRSMELA